MDATSSYLTAPQYGYDFVLSTTQASINANLLQYLDESDQPEQYICYLADPDTGNPAEQITLEDLIAKSGFNPFDIPDQADTTGDAIKALTAQRFLVGIRIRIGLPPDVEFSKLPTVVTLGDDVKQVRFNMLCSDFTVIQNSPPNGWGGGGRWDVWSQPDGDFWSVSTNVNLKIADLDNELSTPYFQNHPQEKQAILDQLKNLSGSAFSLQQLLFDLDNASLQSNTSFGGIDPASNAYVILQKSFINLWSKAAAEKGQPLVSVVAVNQSADPSQLQLTDFERAINPPRDSSGNAISSPTQSQADASTLDHLCAVNNNTLPQPSPFQWNWLRTDQVTDISGVVAINRGTYAKFLMDQVVPEIKQTCLKPDVLVWNTFGEGHFQIGLAPYNSPQTAKVTDSGKDMIRIEYSAGDYDESHKWLMFSGCSVTSSYTCDVSVNSASVTVKQHLKIYIWLKWDQTVSEANVVDKTLTDDYNLTVTQDGALKLAHSKTNTEDHSHSGSLDGFSNWFVDLNSVIDGVKKWAGNIVTIYDKSIGFDNLQSFIFPGSKVFTYKNPEFSQHEDLICPITYVDTDTRRLGAGNGRTRPRRSLQLLQATASGEPFTITASTDLIENYLQGRFVSPTGKFEALQTADGHGLVFSTDNQGVFHVIEEQLQSTAGWTVTDLSTAVLKAQFSGKTDAQVSTFDVGQSVMNGSISLAMAVRSDNTDTLFVSLGNSNSKTAWIQNPSWTRVPFDAAGSSSTGTTIRSILFAETSGSKEYLIVDIDRSPTSTTKEIERYHVDMTKADGHYWVKHDVPVDISSGDYQSCIGRVKKGRVDGVYTSGKIEGSPQLVYVPIVNVYGATAPAPRRLQLPNGAVPSAIASARNGPDAVADLRTTTDLYVTSDSKLYWFAADAQKDGNSGTLLLEDAVFSQTTTLIATTHDSVTTIWGKNGNNQVYYLSCPTSQVALPGSWSVPVPLLTGIEHLSAYVNRVDGGKTVFASGGNDLFRIEASLTGSKLWKPQKITIAAHPEEKAVPYKSYTSTLQVTDENDLPTDKATVSITTPARTPVFINGLYYVLSQTPVQIVTDRTGSVTVVEATENINAAVLTVTCNGGSPQEVNPMAKSFKKLTALTTEDALRGATVPGTITAGGVMGSVPSVPIVDASTSSENLQGVAAGLDHLQDAYAEAQPGSSLECFNKGVIPATLFYSSGSARGLGDAIAIAAGDIFQWLKSGVEHIVDIIKDAATDTWHFIARIAGKVYSAVLDTVEAVIGAIEWVFNAIKTAIEDLIRFIQFLFEWDDISRTKHAMANIARLYVQAQVEAIPEAKTSFDAGIASLKETLAAWAGTDYSALGDAAAKPASSSASNPSKGQTSGSQLLAHHFRNNAGNLTIQGETRALKDVGDGAQEIIDVLLAALSKEGTVLSETYTQLKDLASKFSDMSVADVLKQLLVILGDAVLDSTQVVVDALMDVLHSLAASAVALIDTKIHIPVISDILNAIGVPDISFLDLFMWITAVGFTVVYKIAKGEAPFPDNDDTKRITSATTWSELSALFSQPSKLVTTSESDTINTTSILPQSAQQAVFIGGHATAGFIVLMGDFLNVFEAQALTGDNAFSITAAIAGILAAAFQGSTDFLVPKHPVSNTAVKVISYATLTATIAAKLIFSGPGQKLFAAKCDWFAVGDGRATGAIVNTVLVIPALCVSGWHFHELSQIPESNQRSAAIVGEVSNMTSYVSRVAYATAVNDYEEITKLVAIGVMAVSNVATAGLQTAEAFLSEK